MLDLTKIGSIHFIGIGGIIMSAAAGMAKQKGFQVTGSDGGRVYSPSKEVLDRLGIVYSAGYSREAAQNSAADLYVLSAGEGPENPEVAYVLDEGRPRSSVAELLFALFSDRLRVVVAGTHGKSTTAGLLGHLLKNLDDSSFVVGGVLQDYGENFYLGTGNYVVLEGDEYKSQFDDPTPKFQYYRPDVLVLTNLEFDHPDIFENFAQIEAEFAQLISSLPEDGLIIYNGDDAGLAKLVHESNVASASYALDNDADYRAESLDFSGDYATLQISNRFSRQISSRLLGATEQYKTKLPGRLNCYNALAAVSALRALGFSQEQLALDLLGFSGIKRRFELVGHAAGRIVVDDYAHHPTAIRQTLQAARLRYPKSRIWAVFEPHTYSRVKAAMEDLASCFDTADMVILSEIYAAREKTATIPVTSADIAAAICRHNEKFLLEKNIFRVPDKQRALNTLVEKTNIGDVVVVMAVGDFNSLAYELVHELKK